MVKALTAIAVEKVQAGATRREIPDGRMPGLYLVVQPSGAKSWAVRYRHRGETRKLTLGRFPRLGLAQARDAAVAALKTVDAGRDPAAEKREERRKGEGGDQDLVPAVIERYLTRHVRQNQHRSGDETARVLRREVAGVWPDLSIRDVTRRKVIELLDGIVDRGSPGTANSVYRLLGGLTNWCIDRDIIEASPFVRLKPPAAEKSRERFLADDEIRFFWQAADSYGFPFGSIFQLLLLTGQRRDEVADMRRSELDLGNALWTLPGERSKNRQTHEIPLSAAALQLLRSLPTIANDSDLIFTTNGRTPVSGWSRTKTRFDAKMQELAKAERGEAVHLSGWRLHDLRRTAASGMARLGINLPVIEKVLNHTSGSFAGIVGVYQRHSFADEKRSALEAWGRFVESLVTDVPASNIVSLAGRA